MIKYFIGLGVNLESETNNYKRPIHYALEFSSIEIIKYIINLNIKLDGLKVKKSASNPKKRNSNKKSKKIIYDTINLLNSNKNLSFGDFVDICNHINNKLNFNNAN